MRMKSRSNKIKDKIDLIEFISDETTFCIELQNLKNDDKKKKLNPHL